MLQRTIAFSLLFSFAAIAVGQSPAASYGTVPSAAIANIAPPDYNLGPGDMVAVTAFGTPEYSRILTVGADGSLLVPYLHSPIPAEGKTAQEVSQAISKQLSADKLVVDPQIDVAIVAAQSHMVTVGGAVRTPSVIYLTRPTTLSDILVRAGGIDPEKAGSTVAVTAGPITREIQLSDVMAKQGEANPPLYGGEHVEVKPAGQVFVAGAANKPGAFAITTGTPLSASRVVAMAGGWVNIGSHPDKAVIVRPLPDGTVQDIPVNLNKIMNLKATDPYLRANDIIYIPGNAKARTGIAIAGAFLSSSAYALALIMTR